MAVLALTIVAVVRVASTHRVFSQTWDEPVHISTGYDWFDGQYTTDSSHPPLARILAALPLRVAGYPRPTAEDPIERGRALLYYGDHYEKTLARARIGNLLLLVVAIIATAAWAARAFSPATAVTAAALFGSIPAVLGHAGLVTTDLAVVATIPLALLALDRFLEHATPGRAVALGLAIAAGVLSKFSFLVFFPVSAVFVALARARSMKGEHRAAHRPVRGALIAICVAFLVAWAGYRFDFRTPTQAFGPRAITVYDFFTPKALQPLMHRIADSVPIPAPAFAVGFAIVKNHDAFGHNAYLLGRWSMKGWWYYFPVVFFYKTPLPFLFLAAWGTLLIARSRNSLRLAYILSGAAVMGAAMTSSINIGVRHILPVYVPLSIVAAYAVTEIWQRSRDAFGRTALIALLIWLFVGVAADHPDYMAWFNEAAQPNPARIAIDSNLDWGQDTLRLARALHEMNIEDAAVDIGGSMTHEAHGIPTRVPDPLQKTPGWVAIGETMLASKRAHGEYAWLSAYRPVRRIGSSIRLYYIP